MFLILALKMLCIGQAGRKFKRGSGTAGPDLRSDMKIMVNMAVILMAAQACPAAAGTAAMAARPTAVNVTVGELSDVSGAISDAAASGDNYKARELLSELFSGGVKAEKPQPVYADKHCPCAVAASSQPAAAAEPAVVSTAASAPKAPGIGSQAKSSNAASEAAKKEKEEAQKLKGFAWGVTIMTVALLFLLILL